MSVFDTKDHTVEFDVKDIEAGRFLSVLAYCWIFVLIPVFAAKDNEFVRFHRRQGLLLFIIQTVYAATISLILGLCRVTVGNIGVVTVGLLLYAGLIIFAAASVLGIINAAKGRAKELPYIGILAERFKSKQE